MDDDQPYRVVDRNGQGWYMGGGGGYSADYGHRRGLPDNAPYATLVEQYGPLRPVLPITEDDSAALRRALRMAGRKATATVLGALHLLAVKHSRPSGPDVLLAGREGSWESEAVRRIAWTIGGDVAERPSRIHAVALVEVTRVIDGWVTAPDRFTEVAETLAGEFGEVVDEAGGWEAVADRYFQYGDRFAHPNDTIEFVQGYLLSRSQRWWNEQLGASAKKGDT